MINFPISTFVNKKISKKLLKKYGIDSESNDVYLRNIFKEELGYFKSENIEEILVIEIILTKQELPEKLIYNLALNIPYKILFILNYNDRYNFAITTFGNKCTVHYSVWGKSLNINFKSSNINEVWKSIEENFNIENEITGIISEEELNLHKELETLERQLKRELDFLKKVELKARIIKIKKELNYDK